MKDDTHRSRKISFKPDNSSKADVRWIIKTILITFTMSGIFNILSSGIMNMINIFVAILILLLIILCGIVFDIIGMAVTTAELAPFHSMAAKRIPNADVAIRLVKAKDKVSNFCNDVVGDICGIVSGSASAAIVAYAVKSSQNLSSFFASLIITATVAAITVGGKAMGKTLAIRYSNSIVYFTAKTISFFRFKRK